jgi:hypothetical protein
MLINERNYKNYGGFSKLPKGSVAAANLSGLGTADRMGWNLDRRSYGMGDVSSDPNSVSNQNYDIYAAAGVDPNYVGTQLQTTLQSGTSTLLNSNWLMIGLAIAGITIIADTVLHK